LFVYKKSAKSKWLIANSKKIITFAVKLL
jgi:hypothetical protein